MIKIAFDARALEQAFAARRSRVALAIPRGLNEGGDKVRTQVQRGLQRQTGVKLYRSITSRVRTVRAYEGALRYEIVAMGRGIPIEEFPVAVVAAGIDGKPWGVERVFARSFKQKFKGGLRARVGSGRFPLRKLYGPALPKELVKGEVTGIFYAAADVEVGRAIYKHIARALA